MELTLFVVGLILVLLGISVPFIFFRKSDIVKIDVDFPPKGFKLFYVGENLEAGKLKDGKTSKSRNNNLLYDMPESQQRKVIYNKMMYSQKFDIQGKPDYIFRRAKDGAFIVVEIKSTSIKQLEQPHKGDLMQLLAYLLIVGEVYEPPAYGYILYKDASFLVRNTKRNQKKVVNLIKDMRDLLKTGDAEANSSPSNCKKCICKGTVCEYYE